MLNKQFFKIPNEIILNNTDSEIFTYIIICLRTRWGKCAISQDTMVTNYGQNKLFFSRATTKLSKDKFIIKNTIYSQGGHHENNEYIIKEVNDNFTIIYTQTILKLITQYKALSYYIKLKRWVNYETYIANNITKLKISKSCGCAKNTSNNYLKQLETFNLITIESDKKLNTFKLTMVEELNIKEGN